MAELNHVDIEDRPSKMIMYYAGIPTLLRCPHDPDPRNSDIALCGIPYSGGNPREKSQAYAPRVIRDVCPAYEINRANMINPYELCRINDLGDAPLPNLLHPDKSSADIQKFYEKIYSANAIPITIGGDHSITGAIFRAIKKSGNFKEKIAVIHFDAHMDAWPAHYGTENHCGAAFMIGTEEGIMNPKKTVQIGIRGFLGHKDQEKYAYDNGFRVITQAEFDQIGVEKALAETRRIIGNTPVYISIDLDALDPIYAPGVAAREINGLSMRDVCKLIQGFRGLNIIGSDIVCYCPDRDAAKLTATNAAALLFELTCVTADYIHNNKLLAKVKEDVERETKTPLDFF